jgi:hypothetical protein
MAELADAPDLGSGVTNVQVRVLLSADKRKPQIPDLKQDPGFAAFFMLCLKIDCMVFLSNFYTGLS